MCVLVCRFDSELSTVQEDVQRERTLREKLAREKDMLTSDVFSLRQQLEVCLSNTQNIILPVGVCNQMSLFLSLLVLERADSRLFIGRPLLAPSDGDLLLLQDKDLEVCAVNLKVDQLEAELQDLNSQESKDEASLAKVFQNVAIHYLCIVTFIVV